jgi:hypothetical protein
MVDYLRLVQPFNLVVENTLEAIEIVSLALPFTHVEVVEYFMGAPLAQ